MPGEGVRRRGAELDTAATMVMTLVLNHFGLAGVAPGWVLALVLLVGSLAGWPGTQLRLSGGDLTRRVGLRIALQLGVLGTVCVYITGWGPVLVLGHGVSAVLHIRLSGSRAWRPALAWGLAGTAVAQLGIATGVVYTALNPVEAQVTALGGALLLVLLVRQFGLSAEQNERAEEARQLTEERFRALVQHSSDMTVLTEPGGLIRYVSPAVEEMLGYTPEELEGGSLYLLVAPEDLHRARLIDEEMAMGGGGLLRTEMRFLHRDGTVRWHHLTLNNMLDTPAVQAVVTNHRDVTEQRFAQEKLAYEASHDMLTGLVNRATFVTELETEIARGRADGEALAVLYVDLDGFKQVNDTLGHDAGDVVLMTAAAVLRRCVLGADLIGRLGGDEFTVVLPRIGSPENAEAVAHRILEGLRTPVPVGGHHVVVEASVGIARAGDAGAGDAVAGDAVGAQELLRRADLAMYRAKRAHGSRVAHYHPGLEPAVRVTAEEIRTAVQDDQLRLVYQPIVSLATGRVEGAEALIRWEHPERGPIGPGEFIPIAEECGLIGLVGEWVLRQACTQLGAWRAGAGAGAGVGVGERGGGADLDGAARQLWVSVNVAADQLEDPRTAGLVVSTLERHAIPPDRVVVEVTESALADSAPARATLEALHEVGVRIAIDDFGTGYSSLQYLTRLPVDLLKLDRAFVSELDGSPKGSAIAEAVLRLAQTLHLSTTAEGVETPEQAAELRAMGYRTAQGYLFARPMPPEQFVATLGRSLDGAVVG